MPDLLERLKADARRNLAPPAPPVRALIAVPELIAVVRAAQEMEFAVLDMLQLQRDPKVTAVLRRNLLPAQARLSARLREIYGGDLIPEGVARGSNTPEVAESAPSPTESPALHMLKTWPAYFDAVAAGTKTFEVRRDDRGGFYAGDLLELRCWDPRTETYDGRTTTVRVTYVLPGGAFGVAAGFVVMGIARVALGQAVSETAAESDEEAGHTPAAVCERVGCEEPAVMVPNGHDHCGGPHPEYDGGPLWKEGSEG